MLVNSLVSAFLLGLIGSVHCFGMCGAIVTLSQAKSGVTNIRTTTQLALWFNTGRILTYSILGFIVGLIGLYLFKVFMALHIARAAQIFSALVLIIIGIYITQVWNGLAWLERLGYFLFKRLQPKLVKIFPLQPEQHPRRALGVGMIWGLMPCGMVYAALFLSIVLGNPLYGAMFMLMFGLGTLPALISMSLLTSKIKNTARLPIVRYSVGVILIVLGIASMLVSHDTHIHYH